VKRNGIGKYLRENWWNLFFLVGAVIIAFYAISGESSGDASRAARRMEKIVGERVGMLDGYMKEAMEQDHSGWMNLEDLPADMVVYRYVNDTLQSWNNQFALDNDDIHKGVIVQRFLSLSYNLVSPLSDVDTTISYVTMGPKWYLVKAMYDNMGCEVIGGLEIINTYIGINRNLRLPEGMQIYPISYAAGVPVSVEGIPLMKVIQESQNHSPLSSNADAVWLAVLLVSIGILVFLRRHQSMRNMLLSMLLITVMSVFFFFIGRQLGASSELFSPLTYADGPFFYSLGGVLIVNIWLTFMVICLYICRHKFLGWMASAHPETRLWSSAFVILLSILLLCVYVHVTFKSIIENSNITLELYRINSLSRFTLYVYVSYIALLLTIPMLIQMLRPVAKKFYGLHYDAFSRPGRVVFAVLSAAYLVAASSIIGFRREGDTVEIWANRMAVDRNLGLEVQLRNVEAPIANDPVIYSLISQGGDYRMILARITENYLGRISQDYDINIYMAGEKESNPDVISYFTDRLKGSDQIDGSTHFRCSRSGSGRLQYTGVFVYYSEDTGSTQLLLAIEPKADREEKGYSSILGATRPGSVVIPARYSYGKYLSGKLVSYKGEYPYPTVLSGKLLSASRLDEATHFPLDGYLHFVNNVSSEDCVVISRERYDFTYYMVSFFLLALVAYFAIGIPAKRYRRPSSEKNYYKSRINILMFFSLLATLVVMAVISVLFVYRRNEANAQTLMTGKINTIQSLVQAEARYFSSASDFATQEMSGALEEISDYTKSDITLYNTSGKVFASTYPEIFERKIIGSRTNQDAYNNIMYLNKRYYIHRERFASHNFYMMYAPIFNNSGKMLSIVGAPYTDSGLEFKSEAVFHAIFIMTVFLILLLLTRLLSTRVVDKLFRPLTEMGRKMNSARTDGLEYIIYDRDDEISSLVRAYNLMVHDLSESSKQAAQVERDKAWSEMARQVAHEIKNPLTPIKLQIQRIIRLKANNAPGWEEKFDSIVPIIMESIDALSDTANEFSTFAKLYSEEPVEIDLDRLASDQVALFDDKEGIDLQYIGLDGATVMGPKPQLTRVLVNLLTNAIQAVENYQNEQKERGEEPMEGQVVLSIRNSVKDGFYDIVVEDNGPGVKDENRSRLFTPNFTTKSSGTGLGLAICKNILERCGGEISYSRSFTLGGACFTVRYPKKG